MFLQGLAIMGRVFLEHMGGDILVNCGHCRNVNISNDNEYFALDGEGCAFSRCVNLRYDISEPLEPCEHKTFLRTVYCKLCGCRLGSFSEFSELNREYEGKVWLSWTEVQFVDGVTDEKISTRNLINQLS